MARARAKELGAYAFLDKPFNIDGLVKVAKKAIKKEQKLWEQLQK
jgi:DNA-binding NtrC family response regulator